MNRWLAPFGMLVWVSGCGAGPLDEVTKPGAVAPTATPLRLYGTAVIGGASKTAEDTARLREIYNARLPSQRGGLFEQVFDMDDKTPGNEAIPTKKAIRAAFDDLAKRVAEHRGRGPTQVFLALGGHGVTSDGVYRFLVAPETGQDARAASFTGDELVSLIGSVGADQMVVVFQSCESGTLVDQDLEEARGLEGLAAYVREGGVSVGRGLAVVTPVHEHVLSTTAWTDVLEEVFAEGLQADASGDGIVDFGEWSTELTRTACQHPNYAPRSVYESAGAAYFPLPKSGVDPRIFQAGSASSIELYAPKVLTTPGRDGLAPTMDPSAICAQASADFTFRYRKDVSAEAIFDRYRTADERAKRSWLEALVPRLAPSALEVPIAVKTSIVKTLLEELPTLQGSTRLSALTVVVGAAGGLESSDPSTFEKAQASLRRILERNDRLAIQVTGIEHLLPSECYAAIRKYLASSEGMQVMTALRRLDEGWAALAIPAADYAALRLQLDRIDQTQKQPGISKLTASIRAKMR